MAKEDEEGLPLQEVSTGKGMRSKERKDDKNTDEEGLDLESINKGEGTESKIKPSVKEQLKGFLEKIK